MLPPTLNEQLLTELRRSVARSLSERGVPQSRIAGVLGVSQAMVSKYVRQPSTRNMPEPTASDLEKAARKLVRALDRSMTMVEARLTLQLELRDQHGFPEQLQLQLALTPPDDPRGKVLTQLQEAARRASTMDLRSLTPQVHLNLAMAIPGATDPQAVAAFPGRFVALHGHNSPTKPPAFGASGHLAGLLLQSLPHRPELRAICNLRHSTLVEQVLQRLGWSPILLRHTEEGLVLPADRPGGELLVDRGGFGREPALYVLGNDGQGVLDRVERLMEGIREEQRRVEQMGVRA